MECCETGRIYQGNLFYYDGLDILTVNWLNFVQINKKGDGINLVVRCEHDAVLPLPNGEHQHLNIKTLNEFDPRVSKIDWRQKLDSQVTDDFCT